MTMSAGDKAGPKRPDVFISYSRKDREFVKRLEAELQSRGREAWVDWEGIRPAEEFMQAILPAIEGTDTFIFVLSPDSVTSEICGRELGHAVSHNKRMIPIMARDVDAKAVPEALAKLNWVFARDADSFEAAADFLISALDTDLDWIHAHTRLLTRAIEWEAKTKSNSFVLRGEDLRAAEQWLAQAGAEKERQPTALQTEYIIASRKAAARRQRVVLTAVSAAAMIALVLAIIAWTQRTKAIEQEKMTRSTFAQADFDIAAMYRQTGDKLDPRPTAHLARALRTQSDSRLPRMYLVSLLRDWVWFIPDTEPLRHEAAVLHASFSPDGTRVVTGSHDKTARIWDARTGQPIGKPMLHEGMVWQAQFSADGRRVLTAGRGSRIWDAQSGEPLCDVIRLPLAPFSGLDSFSADWEQVLSVPADDDTTVQICKLTGRPTGKPLLHPKRIRAAKFTPDGRRVITSCEDYAMRIWDAETGMPLGKPMPHQDTVNFRISADGQLIVSHSDKTAQMWDANSGEPVGQPMLHKGIITSAVFDAGGTRVVTAAVDRTVRVWGAPDGTPAGEPWNHESDNVLTSLVTNACFSPDGTRILSWSERVLRLWDAASGRAVGGPLRHGVRISDVSFSPDGRQLVTASWDHTARVWDAQNGQQARTPMLLDHSVATVTFSRDRRKVAAASNNGMARVWDTETGQPIGRVIRHGALITTVAFSADGQKIVTASYDKTARVWDTESGQAVCNWLRHEKEVVAARFSPNGQRVVTASWDRSARVWEVRNGASVGRPMQHKDSVLDANFSPDGLSVVTASADDTARIWNAKSGEPMGEPLQHKGDVRTASFSPDGHWVVTASADHTARLWNARSGEPLGEAMRHENQVVAAHFSSDGLSVVTASDDKTARVWDARTGKPLCEPIQHLEAVSAANFSSDGRLVVTAAQDYAARLWDAKTGKPAGEPYRHQRGWFSCASLSADGGRMVTGAGDSDPPWGAPVFVWDVAVDVDSRLPPWLPELAEALGGGRFDENGLLRSPAKSIVTLRQELLALKGDDFWSRFGRWFFMRGPERAISPDSRITVGELDRLRKEAEEKNQTEQP